MSASSATRGVADERLKRTAQVIVWAASVCFLITFAFNSLTRRDTFSDPDTMNFVDVARNIATGRGLTQSALGFNQPRFALDETIPAPFTSQPPLYPLLVALLIWAGAPAAPAALTVSVLAFGLGLWAAYQLGQELYDGTTATLGLLLLLFYNPLYQMANTAFSEATGLLFVLLSLWLLARGARGRAEQPWLRAAAGVCAGLAFATRYALLPLAAVGLVAIVLEPGARRRGLAVFAVGFLIPAGLVLGHNWAASGALMPSPNPSNVGLAANLAATFSAIFGMYWAPERLGAVGQMVLVLAALALVVAWLAARQRLPATAREVFVARGRYLLPLWCLAYLAFLVYQRTLTHFDNINPRLVLPASAVLLLMLAALLTHTFRVRREWVLGLAAAGALLVLVREVQFSARTAPLDRLAPIARSTALSWIATETTPRDLIVGLNASYVPYYFGPRAAVSFSPYPYTDNLDYDHLMAYDRLHCGEYARVFLVLPEPDSFSASDWQANFGPFVANLAAGQWRRYAGIELLESLRDGSVFAIHCD